MTAVLILLSLFVVRYFLLVDTVFAHCPLCVAGAGAGLTLSRLLGVDDSITGVWIGAFLGATSFWTQNILARRLKFFSQKTLGLVIYVLFFLVTIWSFYKFNLVSRHGDIFGYDKLTVGMVSGGALFYLLDQVNDYIIKKRGKSFFPYQRLIVGLGSMFFLSLFMYILINYYI